MNSKTKDLYGTAKTVISNKNYELKDMLGKLETLWIQGNITEEQKLELIDMARNNAMAENSLDLFKKIKELNKHVEALERRVALLENGGESYEEEEIITYPEYEIGKWYYAGDKISFKGNNYVCIAPDGAECVWSPNEYPPYWEIYTEDAPLTE